MTWLLWSTLGLFILDDSIQFFLSLCLGVVFFIVPIVNHIGIFLAIRRHNNQIHNAVSGQNSSALFRREKKAAMDTFTVFTVLLIFLIPVLVTNMFQEILHETFEVMYAWSTSFLFINSSINPLIYFVRNRELRDAIRTMMRLWLTIYPENLFLNSRLSFTDNFSIFNMTVTRMSENKIVMTVKTLALHVRCVVHFGTFLCRPLQNNNVEWPNSRFYGEREHSTANSPFSFESGPTSSTPLTRST